MTPPLRDHVLVGLLREDADIHWINARDVAARTGLSAGTVGQTLIRLRDAELVTTREVAKHIRQWQLTDAGMDAAISVLPRRRGQLAPEARGLAPDGSVTLQTPWWTARMQVMDPQRMGFASRRDQFGLIGERDRSARRRRRSVPQARTARGRRLVQARRKRAARATFMNVWREVQRQAQLKEIEETLEKMVADGEVIRHADGGYQLHPDQYAQPAAAAPVATARPPVAPSAHVGVHDTQMLRTVGDLSSGRGWASTRDIARKLGVDGRAIGSQLSYLADGRGMLERWKAGQGATLWRLTELGRRQVAA